MGIVHHVNDSDVAFQTHVHQQTVCKRIHNHGYQIKTSQIINIQNWYYQIIHVDHVPMIVNNVHQRHHVLSVQWVSIWMVILQHVNYAVMNVKLVLWLIR